MKATYITKKNGVYKLEYGERPKPEVREGEALIRVKACAVNHLDLYLRDGMRDIPLPHISGSDIAGEVVEINGRSKLEVGQSVVVNPAIPCGVCVRCRNGLECEKVIILGAGT